MLVWCSFAAARASRLEAAQVLRVVQAVGGQHLDGHVPAQRQLLGLVDDPHAAPAHLAQDLVIPELLQGCGCIPGLGLTSLTRAVVRDLGLLH